MKEYSRCLTRQQERYRRLNLPFMIPSIFMALLFLSVHTYLSSQVSEETPEKSADSFSYGDYAAVLKTYVDDTGMVHYKELQSNREKLDAFNTAIGSLDYKAYESWSDPEKIAFLINAYNSQTLKVILDHYPIKASGFKAIKYPKNSIRQISGVWDKITFPVLTRQMTLEHIEHEILRKNFNEPRIHMALVCAAMGCPPLRSEPYYGDRLSEQLDDQASRFLRDPIKFRIDREKKRVYLSPIFKWFWKDFVKTYGTDETFVKQGKDKRPVLNFITGYLNESDADYLKNARYSVKYLSYDWALNEQQYEGETEP